MRFQFLNDRIKPREIIVENGRLQAQIKVEASFFNLVKSETYHRLKSSRGFQTLQIPNSQNLPISKTPTGALLFSRWFW